MKILYIVPYVPNLIRARAVNLIRALTRRGNQVTVATLTANDQDRRDVEGLSAECTQVFAVDQPAWRSLLNAGLAVPSKKPLQAVYSWNPGLLQQILSRLESGQNTPAFEVIHFEHLRGAQYGVKLRRYLEQKGMRIPIVWDSVDCISYLFKQSSVQSHKLTSRLITRFELPRTQAYERWLVKQFDQVLVTSSKDRKAFQSLLAAEADSANINVLPNGVDLEYFIPDPGCEREPATLVVSGKMSYHANITMVLRLFSEIMPQIWQQRPDVRVWIVGKDPPKELQALDDPPRVVVTGSVPDIRPYLRAASIALAPLTYGAGIQNKVLEAMACGTPVVSTPLAMSGLETATGEELIVADNPLEFSQTVLALLDDPLKRQELSKAGRSYVERHHNWDQIAAQLEAIYSRASYQK